MYLSEGNKNITVFSRTDDHSRTAERQGRRECRVQGGEELLRVRHIRQVCLRRVQPWRRSRCVRNNGRGRQPTLCKRT